MVSAGDQRQDVRVDTHILHALVSAPSTSLRTMTERVDADGRAKRQPFRRTGRIGEDVAADLKRSAPLASSLAHIKE